MRATLAMSLSWAISTGRFVLDPSRAAGIGRNASPSVPPSRHQNLHG
jgi:hypothetical protein